MGYNKGSERGGNDYDHYNYATGSGVGNYRIETLKVVDGLLEDAKSITEVASRRTQDLDGMVGGIIEAAGIVADGVKGNQNIAKAASGIVNATASCVGIVKGKKADK